MNAHAARHESGPASDPHTASATTPREPHGPLAGVRVLDLGDFIAAPTAGRLLAEFGAEVVKVERPGTGDELRHWRLHAGDTSLLFRTLGRNKRSVTLDLRRPEGRDIALRLAARSDVVLENFRPGTLERWGLGPDALRAANPRLVLVRISGYGQTGPYRDRPGFGGVAEAIAGLRALTGHPGQVPTRVGIGLANSVAGLYAVIERRRAHGGGARPPRTLRRDPERGRGRHRGLRRDGVRVPVQRRHPAGPPSRTGSPAGRWGCTCTTPTAWLIRLIHRGPRPPCYDKTPTFTAKSLECHLSGTHRAFRSSQGGPPMHIRGGVSFVGLIYILIGVFVAWDHGYITISLLKHILSALLAIFLWVLILLGVSLHVT